MSMRVFFSISMNFFKINDSFYIFKNWHMVYSYFQLTQIFIFLILII